MLLQKRFSIWSIPLLKSEVSAGLVGKRISFAISHLIRFSARLHRGSLRFELLTHISVLSFLGLRHSFSTSRHRPNRAPATGLSNRFSPLTPCRAHSHLRWNGQFLPPIVVYPSRLPAPTSHGPSPSDIPLLPQNSARPIRELPKISQFGCQLPNHTAPFLRCGSFLGVRACWLGPLN
jgi:hypothetical protein